MNSKGKETISFLKKNVSPTVPNGTNSISNGSSDSYVRLMPSYALNGSTDPLNAFSTTQSTTVPLDISNDPLDTVTPGTSSGQQGTRVTHLSSTTTPRMVRNFVKEDFELPQWDKVISEMPPTTTGITSREENNDSLLSAIQAIIGSFPAFSGETADKIAATALISSNVVSLANSLYIIAKCQNLPKSVKVLNGISLTASIASLASAIYAVAARYITKTSLQTMLASVSDLANDLIRSVSTDQSIPNVSEQIEMRELGKANTDNRSSWSIVGALTTLASLLTAALSGMGVLSAKAFITGSNILKSASTYKKEADSLIKNIATEILGFDILGDRTYIDKLKQLCLDAAELATEPLFKFATNNQLVYKLRSLNQQIVQYTDKKYSDVGTSNIAKGYLSQLNSSRVTLSEKLKLVNEMLSSKQRQTCIGLMLCGKPGVGKSSFTRYLAKECGRILGYRADLYNINTTGGFYEVYGGESFAIYDEFANKPTEDPTIAPLNSIISGDYFNMEGAHLEAKLQPCALKCAFLSSNAVTPNLKATLVTSSIEAFFTRVERVIVEDPLEEGRYGANKHRKIDFSHLKLHIITNCSTIPSQVVSQEISVKQLIGYLVSRMAFEEMAHIKRVLLESEEGYDLQTDKRISFLSSLITHTVQSNTDKSTFFVARIVGDPMTGKTLLTKDLCNKLAKRFKVPFTIITQSSDITQLSVKRGIYAFDDALYTSEDYGRYFNWSNKVDKSSLIFITTNTKHVHKRTMAAKISGCLNKTTKNGRYVKLCEEAFANYPGLMRRVGIPGTVKNHDSSVFNPSSENPMLSVTTLDKTMDGKSISTDEYYRLIETNYATFVNRASFITIVDAALETKVDFDLAVTASSFEDLKEAFFSAAKTLRTISGLNDKVKINIKPAAAKDIHDHLSSFKELFPTDITSVTPQHLGEIATNYARELNKRLPGVSLHFHVEGVISFKLYKGKLYKGTVRPFGFEIEPLGKEGLRLTHGVKTQVYTWKTLASFETIRPTQPEFAEFDENTVKLLIEYLSNNLPVLPYLGIARADNILEREYLRLRNSKSVLEMMKNPLVLTICGIIGVVSTGAIIAKIVSLHAKEVKEEHRANGGSSWSDPDPADPELQKFIHKFQQNLFKADQVALLRAEVKAAGRESDFNAWEVEWRSNFTTFAKQERIEESAFNDEVARLIRAGRIEEIADLIQKCPDPMRKALQAGYYGTPNMVLQDDKIIQRHPKMIDIATSLIRRATVKVTTDLGTNYGLAFKGNLIVTISHSIRKIGQNVSVIDNGLDYIGVCLALDRKRDISLIAITSKNWQSKADITKHIINAKELTNVRQAFFIKAFENESFTHGAEVEFVPTGVPLMDPGNEFYTPCVDIVRYNLIQADTITSVFRAGDCGLPLVFIQNGSFKIMAIHNGYSNSGRGCFSSLSREFLDSADAIEKRFKITFEMPEMEYDEEFASNAFTPSKEIFEYVQPHKLELEGAYCPTDYMEALTEYKPSKFQKVSSEFPVMSFCPRLNIRSNPVFKETYKPICELDFPMTKVPSAITLEHVTDPSELLQDRMGNPHPLATQCAYFGRDLTKGTLDEEALKVTRIILGLETRSLIGKPRLLNLTEAINGNGLMRGLAMDTSTGLYIKMKHKIQTKRPLNNPDVLFRHDGTKFSINQDTKAGKELLDMTISAKEFLLEGSPLLIFAKDNPKVELLPKEKVAKGKVRLFSELDLYVNLVLRMFFGHQISNLFEKHLDSPYAMGTNPYLDATHFWRRINSFKGDLVSTDYKSLDKFIPAILIKEFVDAYLWNQPEHVRRAIYLTMANMYHVMEGNVYPTKRGNVSGSFLTTVLNCFVLDFVNTYTFVKYFKKKYRTFPSYDAFKTHVFRIILGDDKVSKFSTSLEITMEDMVSTALEFGLQLTPAKAEYENEISFCSRIFFWDDVAQVCFPALKQESVYTHIYYGADATIEDQIAHVNVALFEASLWDRAFFERMQAICMEKARQKRFIQHCSWFSYDEYRRNFVDYVRSESEMPCLQVKANLDSNEIKNSKTTLLISNFLQNTEHINMSNYVSRLFEHCQKTGIPVKIETSPLYEDGQSYWTATYVLNTKDYLEPIRATGRGENKKTAKINAARIILEQLGVEKLQPQLQTVSNAWRVKRTETPWRCSDTERVVDADDEIHDLLSALAATGKVSDLKYRYNDGTMGWNVSLDVTGSPCDLVDDVIVPLLKKVGNHQKGKANSDTTGPSNIPVEPMTINSAATYQSVARLPDGYQTAQPVAMAPTMGPPGESINATNEVVACKTLNPVGAPNMLPVGAIGFDAKDLIYTTFLDQDVEIEITNESPSGTVLFQIPYGVDTGYTNSYIKAYAALHERYAGALQYRLTVMGNQLYSGAIGVGWYHRRITTTTVNISEMQKYSWYSKGVQMVSTEDITLHDARQEKFWRKVSEDSGDLSDRPHLVVFLFMSVKNPYDAPSTVRIRVASKLNGATEPNPFQFSNPELAAAPEPFVNNANNSGVSDMHEVYKHLSNFPLNVYTDGTLAAKFDSDMQRCPYYTTGTTTLGLGGKLYGSNTNPSSPSNIAMLPTRYFATRAALLEAWPSLNDRVSSTFGESVVSVRYISTFNAEDLGMLVYAASYTKENGGNMTEQYFNFSKNISNYGSVAPFNILQIHWSDLVYKTGESGGTPNRETYVIGTQKLVTTRGTVIALWYASSYGNAYPLIVNDGTLRDPAVLNEGFACRLDYDRLETASGNPSPLTTILPLGWNKIALTTILPSVVLTGDPTSFTTTDDITMLHDFAKYEDLPLDLAVQFSLLDNRSNRIVATVRYLQEYSMFVINKQYNAVSDYRVLPTDSRYLAITRVSILKRGLEFPVTDTNSWVDRLSPPAMAHAGLYDNGEDYEIVRVKKNYQLGKSNAALAAMAIGGGAVSGIGQGMQAYGQMKFAKQMQGAQFDFGREMQSNQFRFLEGSQQRAFDFQELMQMGRFEQEREMASIHASNQLAIDTNKARQAQISRGFEGRILSMPGSSYA